MVAIKDMEMPRCCRNCALVRYHDTLGYSCKKRGVEILQDEVLHKRADDCPLVEIGTCKDCRWLTTDNDGNYYCRQTGCFDSLDFYCADFEKGGSENGSN